jgi:hypothetical protein
VQTSSSHYLRTIVVVSRGLGSLRSDELAFSGTLHLPLRSCAVCRIAAPAFLEATASVELGIAYLFDLDLKFPANHDYTAA